MVIDLSGEVSPCCFWRGYGGDALPLGQAREASLAEIWNGEPWHRLREDLAHGRLAGYPCATCLSTQWSGGEPPPFEGLAGWRHHGGHCYFHQLPEPFEIDETDLSKAVLIEDDRALGPGLQSIEAIRRDGGAFYLSDTGALFFSTSDGTSPLTNRRKYVVSLPVSGRTFVLDRGDPSHASSVNLAKLESAWRQGKTSVDGLPSHLAWVSSLECNLHCPMCSQNYARWNSQRAVPGLGKQILALIPTLLHLTWNGGEPWVDPEFIGFVERFRPDDNPNLTFGFTSNGVLIRERERDWLEKFSRWNISISVDSFQPRTYARLRRGAELDQVLETLQALQRRQRLPHRRLSVGALVMKSTVRELPDNLQQALDLDLSVNWSPVTVYPPTEQINLFSHFADETRGWREALACAGQIAERAVNERVPAVRRIDPRFMIKHIGQLLTQAESEYAQTVPLLVQCEDPEQLLSLLAEPGLVLLREAEPVAYLPLKTPGEQMLAIPLSRATAGEGRLYWVLTADLRNLLQQAFLAPPRLLPSSAGCHEMRLSIRLFANELTTDPGLSTWTLAAPFSQEHGHCWVTGLPRLPTSGDSMAAPFQSRLQIFENGRAIGVAHAVHQDIMQQGLGRFSHWNERLFFSTSDNTDPNRNGRRYTVQVWPEVDMIRVPATLLQRRA